MDCDIAIVIPCFNEEKTIANVINKFLTVYKDYDFKIFVYDNNSTDKTFEIASSIDKNIVLCRRETKQGKGYVVRSAFEDIDANCYVLVDGDDTYPIEESLEMIRFVKEESYDMVIGDRLTKDYHKINKRKFHSFGNNLVSILINKFFHSNIKDMMTGLRVFSRKYVKTAGVLSQGFEIEVEMTILALDGNYRIKEIPISYRERIEGSYSKLNTFSDGIIVLRTIFTLLKDFRPFEFFSFFSFIFGFSFLLLFIPIFLNYLKTGFVPKYPTLIVSVFFGMLSMLSICTGIILSTIVKMFKRDKEAYKINFK